MTATMRTGRPKPWAKYQLSYHSHAEMRDVELNRRLSASGFVAVTKLCQGIFPACRLLLPEGNSVWRFQLWYRESIR